jgi:hypothetical protein
MSVLTFRVSLWPHLVDAVLDDRKLVRTPHLKETDDKHDHEERDNDDRHDIPPMVDSVVVIVCTDDADRSDQQASAKVCLRELIAPFNLMVVGRDQYATDGLCEHERSG